MKGRDRNKNCWCGSGKKIKNCHYDRENQEKENPWDAVNINRKVFAKRTCCADGVGLGECDGSIVRAHTVSRGPNLTKIAKKGHVLGYSVTVPDLIKFGGRLGMKSIGISDASVFLGFCAKHDRELFSCIENEIFSGRPDQCLAIAYRTLSRELYGKDSSAHLRETLRSADKGKSPIEQVALQSLLEQIDLGNEASRRELRTTHDVLTDAMVRSDPNIVRSLVIEFAGLLPFMFSGAWSPFTDLNGNEIQDGFVDENLAQIFFSSFAQANSTVICVSWLEDPRSPVSIIADQIAGLPRDIQASACLQIVLKHVENVFFSPDWIDSLNQVERAQLDKLAEAGLDFLGSPPSTPVRMDLTFGLQESSRSWKG